MVNSSDSDDEVDGYDIFESSIESLFGQHQAASGTPGQRRTLDLGDGVMIKYKIPIHRDNSNTRLFAHFQWDAGIHLALMLHRKLQMTYTKRFHMHNKQVLELGAGSSLPSLVCALGGAEQVIITDYPDKGIIKSIQENINLSNVSNNAKVIGLDWTNTNQVKAILQESPGLKGYDLILCADTLWLSDFHLPLLEAICQLLKKSNTSRIVLLSGFHTGRRVLTAFYNLAMKAGLCSDWEEEHAGVFEFNAVTRTSRPWTAKIPFPAQNQEVIAIDDQSDDNMDDYTERTKWLLHVTLRWAKYQFDSNKHASSVESSKSH